MSGQLALVLHAHLPFVRHPEHEQFFEEDWLFEAITETYIPLIAMMQRLVHEGVRFKLTMSLTPTLCAMLQDELLQARYVRHIDALIDLSRREIERNHNHAELEKLAQFYCDWFTETRRRFVEEWNRDLVAAFRQLRDARVLEIIGCAATHGLLPLLAQSPQAVRAQVLIGRDAYRAAFGADPAGFWLPECAYAPGIDKLLAEANARWFMLDAHGLMLGKPRPRRAIFAPCFTPSGPAAFARDPDSSRQVWSADVGYPGDPAYRDFYRDVGFDLPPDYVWPGGTTPKFTGIKYHRITGRGAEKELYNRRWAVNVAHAHASDFVESRQRQLHDLGAQNFEPIVVMPFDAELFGHWWYEGPLFLECLMRRAAADDSGVQLTTPTDYLREHTTHETVQPAASSWGEDGYWSVWLQPANAWIYPHLHTAARRMSEAAHAHAATPTATADRVLKQLARELLLAQSSDWAFLIKTGTAKHYAAKRTTDHLERFNKLHGQLTTDRVDEAFLSDCEWRDNIFPNVEWRYYI